MSSISVLINLCLSRMDVAGVLSQSFREFFLVFDFGATSGKNQD